MKRLCASLVVVILLSILGFWTSEGARPELKPQTITPNLQDEKLARKKANFKKGRALLLQRNVPFDPDELLKRGWQQRLKTTLEQMPELQVIQQGDNKLKGAQLAHTLYLPENVDLTGDTVILARRLIFLGRNVVIKGPHDLHIFTIDETQLVDNSPFKKDGGRMVKVGFRSLSTLASLKPTEGHITIDTSGAGRDEWLQQRRFQQLAKKTGRSKDRHHALPAFLQNSDGDQRQTFQMDFQRWLNSTNPQPVEMVMAKSMTRTPSFHPCDCGETQTTTESLKLQNFILCRALAC